MHCAAAGGMQPDRYRQNRVFSCARRPLRPCFLCAITLSVRGRPAPAPRPPPAGAVKMQLDAVPKDKWPHACLGCGVCAAVCPQKIAIPDELAAFAAELEKRQHGANGGKELIAIVVDRRIGVPRLKTGEQANNGVQTGEHIKRRRGFFLRQAEEARDCIADAAEARLRRC